MENIEEKTQEQKEILKHIKKRKYIKAEDLVKADPSLFDFYIQNMGTNQHAKRAQEFITKQGRNLEDFPPIVERLKKKAVRYQLAHYDWELVEEKLEGDKSLLVIAAEDYFFKKNFDVAYTLITKHGLEDYLEKIESKEWLQKINDGEGEEEKPKILENKLFEKDEFSPCSEDSEGKTHVKLTDYNIGEEDVILIEDIESLEKFKDEILAEKKVNFFPKKINFLVRY